MLRSRAKEISDSTSDFLQVFGISIFRNQSDFVTQRSESGIGIVLPEQYSVFSP